MFRLIILFLPLILSAISDYQDIKSKIHKLNNLNGMAICKNVKNQYDCENSIYYIEMDANKINMILGDFERYKSNSDNINRLLQYLNDMKKYNDILHQKTNIRFKELDDLVANIDFKEYFNLNTKVSIDKKCNDLNTNSYYDCRDLIKSYLDEWNKPIYNNIKLKNLLNYANKDKIYNLSKQLTSLKMKKDINNKCPSIDNINEYNYKDCEKLIEKYKNAKAYLSNKDITFLNKYTTNIKNYLSLNKEINDLSLQIKNYKNKLHSEDIDIEKMQKELNQLFEKFEKLQTKINNLGFQNHIDFLSIMEENKTSLEYAKRFLKLQSEIKKSKHSSMISVILGILAGIIALFVAKFLGVDLKRKVLIINTKKDKRFKSGHKVTSITETTVGTQIFLGVSVMVGIVLFYFLN